MRDLVYGQAKINDTIQKKLAANDKSLETIQAKLDGFSTAVKNQLSFNKTFETQLALLVAALPTTVESINAVTMRGGKTTSDPPYPSTDSKKKADDAAEKSHEEDLSEKVHDGKTTLHEFYDTQVLPFPMRVKKPTIDEQFNCFMEVIQQVNINVPLMNAMQVPAYARYLKDIINNKRPLPTTEVVKLTVVCSAAILH